MTREEAREQLIEFVGTFECPSLEAVEMAIEALKGGDAEMNEVKSPYMQQSPNGAIHGKLIDADALMEYCSNQKSKTINNNDIARFPTADAVSREEYDKMKKIAKSWQDEFRNASEIANKLSADRPHGEWIDVNGDGSLWRCDQCKDTACCDGNFCPTCGCVLDMRKENK